MKSFFKAMKALRRRGTKKGYQEHKTSRKKSIAKTISRATGGKKSEGY